MPSSTTMRGVRASRTTPGDYVPAGSVLLGGNKRLLIWLNLAGVPWLALCTLAFAKVAAEVRPGVLQIDLPARSVGGPVVAAVAFTATALVALLVVAVLHEGVHGLGFWFFTRARPVFGFTGWYFYAAAPGWYLTRAQFVVVGLAPLVALSAVGVGLIAIVPDSMAPVTLLSVILNAAGAIGDLYLCVRILAAPASVMIEDRRDGIIWYVPASGTAK